MADSSTGSREARSAAGLTSAEVAKATEQYGKNVLEKPEMSLTQMFLGQFVGTMPWMLELAMVLSFAVQDFADGAILLAMILLNAVLGFREQLHAKRALDELTAGVASEVPARRDGAVAPVDVEDLVPGDVILIVGGDKVPADVTWLEGDTLKVDTAALTGEPIPRSYPSDAYGHQILAGCTVQAGEAYCYVDKTGANTEIGSSQQEILKDKAGGRTVSVFEKNVMKAVRVIVMLSILPVFAVLFVDGLKRHGFHDDWQDVVLVCLSIIIAAVPIALPLVLQVTMALGAARMAKDHGAVVTSSSALQDIAAMSTLCSDKTGTLTTANMSILAEKAWVAPDVADSAFAGRDAGDLLELARLCSNPDKKDDPIDRAVIRAFEERNGANAPKLLEARGAVAHRVGFDNSAKRMTVSMESGLVVAKGLVSKCLDTSAGGEDAAAIQWKVAADGVAGGYEGLKKAVEAADVALSRSGYKTIAIAARPSDDAKFEFLGLLPMIDPPRFDTKQTIANLNHAGVGVKMITGDHQNIAIETARLVGLNQDIRTGNEIREAGPETGAELIRDAGGFAQVLPRDKREVVLTLRNKLGNVVGMTGDGVNDAPALSSAQVGIAVDGATDAAKGAAAIILTTPGLSAIYGGVAESRRIFARLRSYVQYRFAATFHVVVFLSVLSLAYKCEVKPLYVILLAMFNDLTLTPVSNDYASASRAPVDPSLVPILGLAAVYGCVYVAGSLIYYDLATTPGLRLLTDTEETERCTRYVQAALFLQISLAAEFLIFSARAPGLWFLSTPHPMLVATCLAGCVVTSLLVKFAKGFGSLTWTDVGVAWLYSFLVFNVADLAKLAFLSLWGTNSGVLDEHWADHIEDSAEDPSVKPSLESPEARRVVVVPPPPEPTFTNFLYHGTSYDGAAAADPKEIIWPKGMNRRRARLGSVPEDAAGVPEDLLGTPFYHAAKSSGW
eukprot:CAMPEP_0119262516 /NCGR_PEP_ID=MMETSP1329-20130426/2201_1 /TAXON_ID=114041 /ORGANISM="Genus nov. species nov., Strain RCC1024" /LENGTH=954 /DNA_ID=CAMNT_0007262165 /DNA_START=115 /DNA_END=2979 /DNA_ORIENTATION=+